MGTATPSRDTASEQVRALMVRKEGIEAELEAQFSILKSHNCTMQTPLVDEEGFPRADIDIWAVRHARVRIIELRNDLSAVMDDIMMGLQGVYNPALAQNTSTAPSEPAPNPSGLFPFAKVDGVAPGSPAATAVRPFGTSHMRLINEVFQGLLRDDLILSFGSLTRDSFSSNSLQPLASLVASQENVRLMVVI